MVLNYVVNCGNQPSIFYPKISILNRYTLALLDKTVWSIVDLTPSEILPCHQNRKRVNFRWWFFVPLDSCSYTTDGTQVIIDSSLGGKHSSGWLHTLIYPYCSHIGTYLHLYASWSWHLSFSILWNPGTFLFALAPQRKAPQQARGSQLPSSSFLFAFGGRQDGERVTSATEPQRNESLFF